MSTTKHTPGPWTWLNGRLVNPLQVPITVSMPLDGNEEEAPFNAALLATAPELLEALRLLQKAVHDAHLLSVKKHYDLCVADAAAGKAIAKAEGRL